MRFWTKVDMRGPDDCWPWTGSPTVGGYGRYSDGGETHPAHRVSYELSNGPIGELIVMHSCNHKLCCNPAHLSLGTPGDNVRAAARDGLFPTKLTADNVLEIRRRKKAGETYSALAKEFGISNRHVSFVAVGQAWKHLPL